MGHTQALVTPGRVSRLVELSFDVIHIDAVAPFGFRLELDHRLDHGQRRRVGSRLCAPDLAEIRT